MISAWASGTGSAGVIASLSWGGPIALGISPRDVLRLMLIVPAIQAGTFWMLLRSPQMNVHKNDVNNVDSIESNDFASDSVTPPINQALNVELNGLKAKLRIVPKLASFITPLFIVHIFEYICVSGLVRIRIIIPLCCICLYSCNRKINQISTSSLK